MEQVEACLNSRPLITLIGGSEDDGIEALTPGHFLFGQPCLILLCRITQYHCYVAGTSAKILYSIFGEGGLLSIFPRSTSTTNGTIPQETFLWEMWLLLRKMVSHLLVGRLLE